MKPLAPEREAVSTSSRDALTTLSGLLDKPPILLPISLKGEARITGRWKHGVVRAYVPGMKEHVISANYRGQGRAIMRSGRQVIHGRQEPGVISLVPAQQDGHWESGPLESSHVYMSPQRMQACADVLGSGRKVELIGRVTVRDPALFRILDLLTLEVARNDAASVLFVEQALDLLNVQLLRGHSTLSAVQIVLPERGLARWQVNRVVDYMHAHLSEAISLDDLAELVVLSRYHFCTSFRIATGKTPHRALTELRMLRAQDLLTDSRLSITSVAMEVGYQTLSSFAASFRKELGVTPTQFRQGR